MEPIDFVIPWVDGSDPQWIAEKNKWLSQSGKEQISVDAGENRYRDWDNLRYWFRAVEAYAPWVRTVHFVTCGQVPRWLNPEAPRLHLVDHRDYIPRQYLPTFSSHPIELNMHRIPGLAEQFVYFNDDCFLTAPVKPEDFFRNGLPCDCISEEPIEFAQADVFNNILVNNMVWANRHFDRHRVRRQFPGKWYSIRCPHESAKNLLMGGLRNRSFFGIAYSHLPQSYLKSTLEQVWAEDAALLEGTCRHRFRDSRDVNQYVFALQQLLSGRFYPSSRRRIGRLFSGSWDPDQASGVIRSRGAKMICINDSCISDLEPVKKQINDAFAQVLPRKSSFEL